MIVLKGSVPLAFGGTEEPAAYGELVSIGGLNPDVNKKLSAAIASLLESKLSVPKSRFFLKFYDTKASHQISATGHMICCYLCLFSLHLLWFLGSSNSRICSVFTCFPSAIDNVIA